ncbi:MAG TPA: hypothetical protein VEC01_14505 [Noviherbaspirillum sp.]|uniref:hypothetical protein n=1 Tax=Noviherbaspirillum sp. TaxID=1926288 RepID=UPI002D433226|nr:hypothetical protein [Noviherbaspirillum sp.]HYD96537.1 hypothetical protein [Noviherbaspirillum sp.]
MVQDKEIRAAEPLRPPPHGGSKRVLVAIRPEDDALARAILGDRFDVVWCHSYREAELLLEKNIGLVACGVHFDNGKVFDLLRLVRSRPATRRLPFFILLGAGSRYSPAIVQGIRSAAELLGVTAFTDLTRMAEKFGREQMREKLVEGMLAALPAARG